MRVPRACLIMGCTQSTPVDEEVGARDSAPIRASDGCINDLDIFLDSSCLSADLHPAGGAGEQGHPHDQPHKRPLPARYFSKLVTAQATEGISIQTDHSRPAQVRAQRLGSFLANETLWFKKCAAHVRR